MTTYELNTKTLKTLQELSKVNQSIMFQDGSSELWVLDQSSSILAHAEIDLTSPGQFGIYDVNRFLGVVSLLGNEPKIVFNPHNFMITGERETVTYLHASANVMPKQVTKKVITLHETDPIEEFVLPKDVLSKVRKAAAILGVEHVSFVGNGHKVLIRAANSNSRSSDHMDVELANTDKEFEMTIRIDRLVIADASYDVIVASNGKSGVVYFNTKEDEKNENQPLIEYWIAEGMK